jgi:TolA-binding protein
VTNALDLHPEDLIDKLVTGELSDAETERLRAHVAVCSVCRLEIALRDDLDAEAPEAFGARPPLRAPEQPEREEVPPLRASHRPRAPLRRPLILLAVAAILGTGGALAAVLTGLVHAPWVASAPTVPDVPAPSIAPPAPQTRRAVAVAPGIPMFPAVPPSPLEAAPELLPRSDHPRDVNAVKKRAENRPAPAQLRSTRAAVAVTQEPAPPVDTAATVRSEPRSQEATPSSGARPESSAAPSAASLFAAANRARRDGNVASAVELYRRLEQQYPSSAESQLSRALVAKLLLDNGDAEAALSGYDRYLSEGTPVLTAESLVGRARALEQLGKLEEAATSWRAVLQRFPGSIHARLAAARLSALGAR